MELYALSSHDCRKMIALYLLPRLDWRLVVVNLVSDYHIRACMVAARALSRIGPDGLPWHPPLLPPPLPTTSPTASR